MNLKQELRDSQITADAGHYAKAYGMLEMAVAAYIGPVCLCRDCGGPNREDAERCPMCEENHNKKLKELGWEVPAKS